MKHSENVVKTSEVIGVDVYNLEGEKLGEVEEIMLDKQDGNVRYAVLSFGGFLGMGEKLFALPWKALTYDVSKEGFTLKIDKEKLKNAPGFDKDHWPDVEDRVWREEIFKFYDQKPYWNN